MAVEFLLDSCRKIRDLDISSSDVVAGEHS